MLALPYCVRFPALFTLCCLRYSVYKLRVAYVYSHCMQEVLESLSYCHEMSIVHRDLKVWHGTRRALYKYHGHTYIQAWPTYICTFRHDLFTYVHSGMTYLHMFVQAWPIYICTFRHDLFTYVRLLDFISLDKTSE